VAIVRKENPYDWTHYRRLFIMKKTIGILLSMALIAGVLSGCGASAAKTEAANTSTAAAASTKAETTAAASKAEANSKAAESTQAETANAGSADGSFEGSIDVISREDGSGTRGAFIELMGIEEKNASGEKVDNTTQDAEITNSTEVMITTVAGDAQAIGYISLGSLNDTVKALSIDGAEATVDNIKSGKYKVARPFNIVTKGDVSAEAQDFIKFIFSEDGQKVVEDNGYISQGNEGAYTAAGTSGKITVAGSSSVTPVMEKLAEAYKALNPQATIEVQQSDSTTGVTSAIQGVCDIGMASRELKDSETSQGVKAQVIAMDGIAVIVNKDNGINGLTSDQVKSIYVGDTTDWSDLK
jgi:phosphate transport system substrate-binding protein